MSQAVTGAELYIDELGEGLLLSLASLSRLHMGRPARLYSLGRLWSLRGRCVGIRLSRAGLSRLEYLVDHFLKKENSQDERRCIPSDRQA